MFGLITLLASVVGFCLLARRLSQLEANDATRFTRAPSRTVSVVVPAHNQAHNLPTLLESLAALEHVPEEIIVVDDHSDDGTAEVAARYGAIVVAADPASSGVEARGSASERRIVGKTWACVAGAQVARSEYLLFTDADTLHGPNSLTQAMSALMSPDVGLVTFVPSHRVKALWERFQGVFQLLVLVATRAGSSPAKRSRHQYANGQYLLFRRDVYEAIDGHRALSPRVAEDLAFARKVSAAGYDVRVLFAEGSLRVRMYPQGFRAFFAGFRRNFRDSLGSSNVSTFLEVLVVVAYLLGAPLCLLGALLTMAPSLPWWLAIYLGTSVYLARVQRRYGDFGAWSALFYPLFTLVFVAVSLLSLLDALRNAPVGFRGRNIEVARG